MFKRVKTPKSNMFFEQGDGLPAITAEAHADATVLETAIDHRIELSHSCGGMGSCGTCRVFVLHAPIPLGERNEVEAERASDLGFKENERLACQIHAQAGLRVKLP